MLHTTLAIHYGSELISQGIRNAYRQHQRNEDAPKDVATWTEPAGETLDEPVSEIDCEFTLTLATSPPSIGSDSCNTSCTPDTDDDSSFGDHSSIKSLSSREAYDPRGLFTGLFAEDGRIDLDFVRSKTSGLTLRQVLTWIDVDHYNLLEKAVVYNNRELVKVLLQCDVKNDSRFFGFRSRAPEKHVAHFRGAIHLAAFLGCQDLVKEFLDHNISMCLLRGPVHIRPVTGPPSDLFRIIGYEEFTRNPRLTFQMMWLKNHPNERPIHYAICGGYPAIMDMLMSYDTAPEAAEEEYDYQSGMHPYHPEKDALLASLIRQAAACASYSCLSSLLEQAPDAMYMRDQRGWLYIMSGLPHGMQFVRFLVEHGFAVKVLNNVDGRNSVNVLHMFYSCMDKSDGVLSKFSEIYDVTEFLIGLGVDANMETGAFRSHDTMDTPLHCLVDQLNLVVTSVAYDENFPFDSRLAWDVQQVFDESVRDAIYLILESGFSLDRHCNSLLKRLFMNRNFLKRYKLSKTEQSLIKSNYGIRHMYNIAKLLLSDGGILLSPARREITPSLSFIDTLREESAIECVLGERRVTQIFNSCLQLLYKNGDNPNIYPFSSKDDSYLPTPLLHFCDIYLGYVCRSQETDSVKSTVAAMVDLVNTMCEAGAHFTCFMNVRGKYLKHGVFDHCRQLFHVIHRQLKQTDQSLNAARLHVVTQLMKTLVQYGARHHMEEYSRRKSHLPATASGVETTLLGQVLLLGLHCTTDSRVNPHGHTLVATKQFRSCLSCVLDLADHREYYTCLRYVIAEADDTQHEPLREGSPPFLDDITQLAQSVRPLMNLARIAIRQNTFPNIKRAYRFLPLPRKLLEFVIA